MTADAPRGARPRRGALFWRVYLHGVGLLLLVGIAVAAVGFLLSRGHAWRSPERVAVYAAERVAELRRDPARLADELRRVREVFGIEATVYAPDGESVVASSAEPALAPAPPGPLASERPGRVRGRGLGFAVALPENGGHAVFAPPRHDPDPRRALLFLAAVLGALAVASLPLARSIAAPVERITDAARALGAGDLSVRARVRARGEMGELARAFDDMAERLERLVRGEKELLANVSHELRTPLARIRVALELAAEGDLDRARRHLAGIGADLEELDRLVEDLLSAARLDLATGGGAAALPLRSGPVDLPRAVAAAEERFRAHWPGRTLEVSVSAGLPELRGDAALLRRLLANLLDNAAKYSEAPSPVRLSVRGEGGAIVIEVRDRGIGIAPEDLPRLFTPFFRTDRSRARGTGGVGLGLALARRIAAAHGGEIAVESAPEAGTVFRVTLGAVAEASSQQA